MDVIKQKEIYIRQYLLRFLIQVFFALSAAAVTWLLSLYLLIYSGGIIPANRMEKAVEPWLEKTQSSQVVKKSDIPSGVEFAIYNKKGICAETNFSTQTKQEAESFLKSGEAVARRKWATKIFRRIDTDTQIIILTYQLKAAFRNPVLAALFPDFEIGFLLYLFLLIFGALIIVCIHNSKNLAKKIQIMKTTADEIGKQNLDFTIPNTGIKEFNLVMESLAKMREALTESLHNQWQTEQEKRSQMSALAHDIKTPLTIIRGNAELLKETPLEKEQKEHLKFIIGNVEQIQEYVIRILEVSKSSGVAKEETELPISLLMDQLKENVKNLGYEKSLKFQFETENFPENICVDIERMKRTLWNLLDNAVQYSPIGGTIHFSVRHENTASGELNIVFEITDEGPGFSQKDMKFAKKWFYRADNSRSNREHFGMGLAIAKQITEEMGGSLILSNSQNKGASVKVIIKTSWF